MKVWFLDTGTLEMDRSQVLWNAPGGEAVEIPTFGVLIEHAEGLILADTGMDFAHARAKIPFMRPEQAPQQTILAQLELCGFSPEDVGTVVNSHLHFDHMGGNRHFPGAQIVVHEREVAQARSPRAVRAPRVLRHDLGSCRRGSRALQGGPRRCARSAALRDARALCRSLFAASRADKRRQRHAARL